MTKGRQGAATPRMPTADSKAHHTDPLARGGFLEGASLTTTEAMGRVAKTLRRGRTLV
jgi:hypothetical protein